jgi:hypothetical protein
MHKFHANVRAYNYDGSRKEIPKSTPEIGALMKTIAFERAPNAQPTIA